MKNKAAEDAASAAEKVSYPDLGPMAVMAKEGAEAEWSGPLVHISDFDASTGKADLGDIGASESEATEGEMGRALIFGEACRGFGFILNPYTQIRREFHSFPSKVAEIPAFVSKMLHQSLDFHKCSFSAPGVLIYEPDGVSHHPLLDEGRIREPKSRSVLRACKFARQPEE